MRAQAQLSELEQTLERERAAHMALVASFEDKGRHVELLTEEVSELAGAASAGAGATERTGADAGAGAGGPYGAGRRLRRQGAARGAADAKWASLQGQQGRAQAQLSELEQTLERERAAHMALVASFEDKGRHVELLTEEVSELAGAARARPGAAERTGADAGAGARGPLALVASFEDKGRHVELLTEEVSELAGAARARPGAAERIGADAGAGARGPYGAGRLLRRQGAACGAADAGSERASRGSKGAPRRS